MKILFIFLLISNYANASDEAFYLDKKTSQTVHICSEKPGGKVMVSAECSGFFGLFFKEREAERSDLVKYIQECDGIRQQKDLVMMSNNIKDIMWATQMFDDGTVYLFSDTQKDRTHYRISHVKDLIREVPEYKEFKKDQTVCLIKKTTYEDKLPGSLIQPFPVNAEEGSQFVIQHLFANGYAKVKYKDKNQLLDDGYTSVLQAVSVDSFKKCN